MMRLTSRKRVLNVVSVVVLLCVVVSLAWATSSWMKTYDEAVCKGVGPISTTVTWCVVPAPFYPYNNPWVCRIGVAARGSTSLGDNYGHIAIFPALVSYYDYQSDQWWRLGRTSYPFNVDTTFCVNTELAPFQASWPEFRVLVQQDVAAVQGWINSHPGAGWRVLTEFYHPCRVNFHMQ